MNSKVKLGGCPSVFAANLNSGFLVFLITLPLSMAIAVASGCPALSGMLASIVGGLITGFVGGARLSIKGAPAGLIVIVLAAVNEFQSAANPLAGYQSVLAIAFAAGIIQILLGFFKLGKFIDYIPASVVHGMISAIGFIVIAKQSYTLLGIKPGDGSPLTLLISLPTNLGLVNPVIAAIGITSILIMIYSFSPRFKKLFKIPGALAVLLFAICASWLFSIEHEHSYVFLGSQHTLSAQNLIHLPESLLHGLVFPNWSTLLNLNSLQYIFLFSVIGSIESLLTVKALNKSSPPSEQADLNKDLVSIGIANSLAALIGGMPMISEIGRSKANIDFGARNSWSNFFHGALLLIAVLFLADILDLVPLAALAGILMVVGFRLFSIHEWHHAWQQGPQTLAVYFTTFILTITVDLLAGVLSGFVLYLIFKGFKCSSIKRIFLPHYDIEEKEEHSIISFKSKLIYTNLPNVKKITNKQLVKKKSVFISCEKCSYIEQEFIEELENYIKSSTNSRVQFLRAGQEF